MLGSEVDKLSQRPGRPGTGDPPPSLRPGHGRPAHPGRGGPHAESDPGAHPPDRALGPVQASPSVLQEREPRASWPAEPRSPGPHHRRVLHILCAPAPLRSKSAPVAQRIERPPSKRRVAGSRPLGGAGTTCSGPRVVSEQVAHKQGTGGATARVRSPACLMIVCSTRCGDAVSASRAGGPGPRVVADGAGPPSPPGLPGVRRFRLTGRGAVRWLPLSLQAATTVLTTVRCCRAISAFDVFPGRHVWNDMEGCGCTSC